MTLQQFWNIIEQTWQDLPELNALRKEAIATNNAEQLEELSFELEGSFMEPYETRLAQLNKEEFTSYIHHLEERMYHIDRQEIHEFTDGSDDGFLYCRCFIVGMGETYYNMIDANPSKATFDLEAEIFGFSAYGVYEEKFEEEFDRYQHHSMETASNPDGWKA